MTTIEAFVTGMWLTFVIAMGVMLVIFKVSTGYWNPRKLRSGDDDCVQCGKSTWRTERTRVEESGKTGPWLHMKCFEKQMLTNKLRQSLQNYQVTEINRPETSWSEHRPGSTYTFSGGAQIDDWDWDPDTFDAQQEGETRVKYGEELAEDGGNDAYSDGAALVTEVATRGGYPRINIEAIKNDEAEELKKSGMPVEEVDVSGGVFDEEWYHSNTPLGPQDDIPIGDTDDLVATDHDIEHVEGERFRHHPRCVKCEQGGVLDQPTFDPAMTDVAISYEEAYEQEKEALEQAHNLVAEQVKEIKWLREKLAESATNHPTGNDDEVEDWNLDRPWTIRKPLDVFLKDGPPGLQLGPFVLLTPEEREVLVKEAVFDSDEIDNLYTKLEYQTELNGRQARLLSKFSQSAVERANVQVQREVLSPVDEGGTLSDEEIRGAVQRVKQAHKDEDIGQRDEWGRLIEQGPEL